MIVVIFLKIKSNMEFDLESHNGHISRLNASQRRDEGCSNLKA